MRYISLKEGETAEPRKHSGSRVETEDQVPSWREEKREYVSMRDLRNAGESRFIELVNDILAGRRIYKPLRRGK
jgi:hypothetical protein